MTRVGMQSMLSCVVASVMITACSDDLTQPVAGRAIHGTYSSSVQVSRRREWLKRPSDELADRIPSFGGAFLKNDVLNIYVADMADSGAASGLARAQLVKQRRAGMRVRFLKGKYSYRKLQSYVKSLFSVQGSYTGVSRVWVDEWTNQLRIGVINSSVAQRVTARLTEVGVPNGAALVEIVPYAQITSQRQLTSQVPTLVGGLEVRVDDTHGETGTLTAIVDRNGEMFALIASHVADATGNGDTQGVVHQDNTGRRIGVVAVNPAFVGGIASCPSGERCRYSDAALVRLDNGIDFDLGSIARPLDGPLSLSNGSTTFDDANPIRLNNDGEVCSSGSCSMYLFPGDYGSKIGITTGWTGGLYVGVFETQTGPDGLTRLQVNVFQGNDEGGDSGAPVLNSEQRLIGIAWGAGVVNGFNVFLVSTYENLGNELAGSPWNLHPVPPYMLGYEQHMLVAPCEPYDPYQDPDNFDMYLAYGYFSPEPGTYERRGSPIYMGNTGYRCWGTLYFGTYQYNSVHQQCTAYFNQDCPCAAEVAGGDSCPVS